METIKRKEHIKKPIVGWTPAT